MQVAGLGLLMYWTKECELGILEIRNDRKAISNAAKKFGTTMSRLSTALTRGTWKTLDEHMTPLQRLRLESLVAVSNQFIPAWNSVHAMASTAPGLGLGASSKVSN